jgi:hypothetical protein
MRKGFPRISEEKQLELKERRIKERKGMSLALQLGYFVGEQIVSKSLPTLYTDPIHTGKVISVTHAEKAEYERLNTAWFTKRSQSKTDDNSDSEEEWGALRAYDKMLEVKYLPPTIKCFFGPLYVAEEHMADFKKGLGYSLWDCDCSHYSTKPENIEVKEDEDGYFTIISLHYDNK